MVLAPAARRREQPVERRTHGALVSGRAARGQRGDLPALDLVRHPQDLQRLLDRVEVHVDADHLLVALLQRPLVGEGRVGDLGGEPAVLDALEDPAGHRFVRAQRPDLREHALGLGLDRVGERLDVPRAAQRVRDVGHPHLLQQHLLGPQRDLGGLGRRQGQHLVEGVGVQRVGAAEHGGEGLHGRADHVVVGLLGGERDAGGLGVEAQLLGLVGAGAVDVAQPARPDPAGRPGTWRSPRRSPGGRRRRRTARARTGRRPAPAPAPARRRRTRRPACTPAPARPSSRPPGCGSRTPRSACTPGCSGRPTPSGRRSAAGAAPAGRATPSGRCTP